jgi:hypothetical protein
LKGLSGSAEGADIGDLHMGHVYDIVEIIKTGNDNGKKIVAFKYWSKSF